MPTTRSAIKALRQTVHRTQRNTNITSELRTLTRRLERYVTANQRSEAAAFLPKLIAKIDRAARRGVLHRNTAARHKARLTRLVNRTTPSRPAASPPA